ncbi:hypothetical protein GCM10009836_45610 [Pseudonocardia ailaonensis]|uniref:HTH merR-type domain-containing protein n=1 Tax=Pseudonocardia ailaonensis TaxID=367279 RepID=A0ABN2NAR1_9PSEU
MGGEVERDGALDVRHLAVTRDSAARIARLSLRQVDYWASTGVLEPTTDRRLSPGTRVRLYSFVDLLALMAAAEMKARGISLQHIRAVVEHLRTRGYERPLTELVFATVGRQIYFQHPDGSWEGDVRPDQIVMHQVLDLAPLRNRIESEATERAADTGGRVERRRGAMGGKVLVAGTRVPVETVVRYLEAGRSVEQILASFPSLTAADVRAARRGA